MQTRHRYDTVEQLEQDFNRRIEAVDDPLDKAELRVQMADARIEFRNQEAHNRMVDAWKRLAVVEYPGAGKFPELITGNTEDEIKESARNAHERVTQLQAHQTTPGAYDQVRERAQELYGRSGSGGIGPGSGVPSPYVSPEKGDERWAQNFAQSFNDAPRDVYGQRMGLSPSDIDRYTRHRFVGHVSDRVRFWGQLTRSDGLGR